MAKAKLLVAGSDIWLNNPMPPFEASGTSGMKAALCGVPQISTNDGWWIEAGENTGWTFGTLKGENEFDLKYHEDAESLYNVLNGVLDEYYNNYNNNFVDKMLNAIIYNGIYFNTQRMVEEYRERMWK